MTRTLAELVAAAGTPRWRRRAPEAPWPVEVDTCHVCRHAVYDDPTGRRAGHPDAPIDVDGRTIHQGCAQLAPPPVGDVDRTELGYLATATSASHDQRETAR